MGINPHNIQTGSQYRSYKIKYKEIIENIWSQSQNKMPEHLKRLHWTEDELRSHQTQALREILTLAKQRTVFYGDLLKSVDTKSFNLEDLTSLPPTNKREHMERWDDFITVPGLTYVIAESHLEKLRKGEIENPFYDDKYLFIATGGSTGKRGLFLWDNDFLRETICSTYRILIDKEQKAGYEGPMRLATVEAPTLLHGSRFVFSSKPVSDCELLSLGSTVPMPEQCEKLNSYQPTHIMAFASSLSELASAQIRGKLNVSPRWVGTNSSPLDDHMRGIIKKAWGIKTCNGWGCVEIGEAAEEPPDSSGMVIWDDGVILEVVDENNNPVHDAKDATKMLATSLVNKSCPMIRYEIDDIVEIQEGFSDYPAYRRITNILGRATNWFQYGDIRVHPMAFSDILDLAKEIEEYQVVQTEKGGKVRLVCNGEPDKEEIVSSIKQQLIKYGLKDPEVKVEIIDALPRHPETGKVKRFVALN